MNTKKDYSLISHYASDLLSEIYKSPDGNMHMYYTGQAGYIIKTSLGTTLGIDLYLSDCVSRTDGFKRLMAKILDPESLDLSYILSTHRHYDHYDLDSVPKLLAHSRTRMIASVDCMDEIKKSGLQDCKKIEYLRSGDKITAEDITIYAVDCDHGSSAPEAIGLIIETDGIRIYIAGDTCLHLEWAEKMNSYGDIDVAILPINGEFGNLSEHEAALYAEQLHPSLVIPSHYWCFAEHHGDPGIFQHEISINAPNQEYLILMQGEEIVF